MSVFYSQNKDIQKNFGSFEYDDADWQLKLTKSGKPYLAYIGQETDGRNIEIPKGLKSLDHSFAGTNIEIPPIIPEGIVSARCAFMGCKNLSSPAILPKSIKDTDYMYDRCQKEIQDAHYIQTKGKQYVPAVQYKGPLGEFSYDPNQFTITKVDNIDTLKYIGKETDGDKIDIPKGVKSLAHTFEGTGIETPPKIPGTVHTIDYMCADCKNLMSAPFIPSSVYGIDKNHSFDTHPHTVCKGCAQAVEQAGIDHVNHRGFTGAMYTCAKDVQKQVKELTEKAYHSIENVKDAASEKIYQFKEDIPVYEQAARDVFKDISAHAALFAQTTGEFAQNITKSAISSADAIRQECASNIRAIKNNAIKCLNSAKEFTQSTKNKVIDFGKEKIKKFSEFTNTVYSNFVKSANDLAINTKDGLVHAMTTVKNKAIDAKDAVISARDTVKDGISSGIHAGVAKAAEISKAAKDKLETGIETVSQKAKEVNDKVNPYRQIAILNERISELEARLGDDAPPSKAEIRAQLAQSMGNVNPLKENTKENENQIEEDLETEDLLTQE